MCIEIVGFKQLGYSVNYLRPDEILFVGSIISVRYADSTNTQWTLPAVSQTVARLWIAVPRNI